MLLLACLLVADLSLFTADPADVADYAKRLDEGVPWVDQYGQPTAGEWEGKVEGDGDFSASATSPASEVLPPADVVWADGADGFGFCRVTGEAGESHPGPRVMYLGVADASMPFTPTDGRRFLFAELPGRTSPAVMVNPYQRPADLGTVYVSHARRNLRVRLGDSWPQQMSEEMDASLREAGFTGFGDAPQQQTSLPHWAAIDLPHVSDAFDDRAAQDWQSAGNLTPNTDALVVAGDVLPTEAETRALLAGKQTPGKLALLDHLASAYPTPQAMLKAIGVKRANDLRRKAVTLDEDDFALVHAFHRATAARRLRAIVANADESHRPLFSEAPGFDGLIVHGETVPAEVDGPVILVVTLPMEAPGFAGMSEDEAVRRWRTAVRNARKDDRVVAVLWGRFWDDPVTGIGPKTDDIRLVEGRAEAAGLWDVTGRPKVSLLKRLNAE